MVYLDMNLRETIPSQTDIEEFLARDFFPKYPDPMPLAETVDMVQLQFEVPDDARALPCPRAHGTDGTILECLTWFAMKRLEERGFLVRVSKASYRWKVGVKYYGKEVPRRDLSLCLYRIQIVYIGLSKWPRLAWLLLSPSIACVGTNGKRRQYLLRGTSLI